MSRCRFCQSGELQIISSNPYGEEIVIHCTSCDEIFEVTKDELENDEYNEDKTNQFLIS